MATYKKKGLKRKTSNSDINQSTTAEVFDTLDQSASSTERIVAKYQKHIIGSVLVIVIMVLGFLGYSSLVLEPNSDEANNELFTAQNYFSLALEDNENSDSLFLMSLNGGEGKYGFLDIIENYKGTPAAKLAKYSAGMAYLNLKQYENAIAYLDEFSADDVLLSALAKGAIGDAYAQLGQVDKAFNYYIEASKINNNMYSTPKYLYKAAMLGAENGKRNQAIEFLNRIENEYPKSEEAKWVAVQKGKLEHMNP